MHIRAAEIKDIARLVDLGRQLFDLHLSFDKGYYAREGNFNQLFGDWLKNQLSGNQNFILVAENENLIVGFISGFIKSLYPWFQTKKVGHISFLIVDPQFRNKGVGKLLEEKALSWFKSQNIAYIELYVEEKNFLANKAWSLYGYLPFKKFLRKKI